MKRLLGILVLGGLLVAATPESYGGWATVTLLEVPEYLEVGTPHTISFKIRQHGETVMWDREPSLILPATGFLDRVLKRNRVPARKSDVLGVYEATITPETAGELAITIDMDFLGLQLALLPFRVVEQEAGPVKLSEAERGRQLFVAKGCVSCHARLANDQNAHLRPFDLGPPLVGRTYPVDYLTMKIGNPAEGRIANAYGIVMPQLELDASEVAGLVRYLNASVTTEEAGGHDPKGLQR